MSEATAVLETQDEQLREQVRHMAKHWQGIYGNLSRFPTDLRTKFDELNQHMEEVGQNGFTVTELGSVQWSLDVVEAIIARHMADERKELVEALQDGYDVLLGGMQHDYEHMTVVLGRMRKALEKAQCTQN